MTRLILAALIVWAFPLSSSADVPRLETNRTIVGLWALDPDNGNRRFLGSGVLFSDQGYALTARHVVEGKVVSEKLQVSLETKNPPYINILATECAQNLSVDICLVQISPDYLTAQKLNSFFNVNCYKPDDDGQEVLGVGFIGGLSGPVIDVDGKSEHGFIMPAKNLFASSMQLVPGMSGGPVFDRFQNVIGVIHGSDAASQSLGLFTPMFKARNLIQNTGVDCPVNRPIVVDPEEAGQLVPVEYFPAPRLLDVRTIQSPKDSPLSQWYDSTAVVSIELLSYRNVIEPGPKASVAGETMVLGLGEREIHFSEFQRVDISSNGEGWLGRTGPASAVTIDDGNAAGHTTQFKPVEPFTWKEFVEAIKREEEVSVTVTTDVSWRDGEVPKRSKISTTCDPTLAEESVARKAVRKFEQEWGRPVARIMIHCRGE
ncbi:trypsin-like peptidase domain-containing protein [Parasedimentitalea maritima]|uniref:Trypsin-like peptidase domain-containing protein n=1 Tax=Parasedimentitalea maritima TaxID=2578117 RepID=A0ABY2USA4_9RHOB|nr:serine protease [Zongyanglinia marina]TLP60433.1 trypsin-like peptidase domain-containing protein [Zongyanglinia marina]